MLTRDAAALLGIARQSVARLCKRGVIRAEKRGRDYWIEPDEVARYQRERRRPGHPRKGVDTPKEHM